MELNLCMGCMREAGNQEICPYCGFSRNGYRQNSYSLPLETILAGKYLVGRVIGEGGFGITYVGYDLAQKVKIAIKEFYVRELAVRDIHTPSGLAVTASSQGTVFQQEKRKFLEEAQRLARFWGLAGIVEVRDFFQENGTAYIIMEFVEGQTFQQVIDRQGGRVPPGQVLEMMRPVMESLEKVHQAGLIHRDISPDNIMITPDMKGKLIDFGAARNFIQRAQNMSVILKPHYAPLEQYSSNGRQGPWTDVYGLCATMYRAITGCLPNLATDRQERDFLRYPSELGIKMPENQEAALMRGLSLPARERFQSMGELMRALYSSQLGLDSGKMKAGRAEHGFEVVAEAGRAERGFRAGAKAGRVERRFSWVGTEKEPRNTQPGRSGEQFPGKEIIGLGLLCGCVIVALLRAPFPFPWRERENGDTSALPGEVVSVGNGDASPLYGEEPEGNILMEDYAEPNDGNMVDYYFKRHDKNKMVLGSDIYREMVSSIHFLPSLADVPDDSWDVSAAGDGRVMAWVEPDGDKYNLYIAGEGGVCANENSRGIFAHYTEMTEIDFGSCFDTSQVKDMSAMFSGCESLAELDLSSFDTRQVTDMSLMFEGCHNLAQLDVTHFDTSQVANMFGMFTNCVSLTQLDVTHFDTSQVTDMSSMFNGCAGLVQLDVTHFDTSQVTDMGSMFSGNSGLTQLDIAHFDTSQVANMHGMFEECSSLTRLDVTQFNTSQVTNMNSMFRGCSALTELDTSGFDKTKVEDDGQMMEGTIWE